MELVLHVPTVRITWVGNLLCVGHTDLSLLGPDTSLKHTKPPVCLSMENQVIVVWRVLGRRRRNEPKMDAPTTCMRQTYSSMVSSYCDARSIWDWRDENLREIEMKKCLPETLSTLC